MITGLDSHWLMKNMVWQIENFEKLGMKIEATGKSTAAAVKLKC